MELQGLLPAPAEPYSGLCVSEFYTKIQQIRSPTWCVPGNSRKGQQSQHPCDLRKMVLDIADPITRLADGPTLGDFDRH
jgi:hypothetical protein